MTTSPQLISSRPRIVPTGEHPVGRRRMSRDRIGQLFVVPTALFLLAFAIIPAVANFTLSFFDWSPLRPAFEFVGIDNYVTVLRSESFLSALGNTAIYAIITVPVSIGLALLVAVGIMGRLRGAGALKAIYFMPTAAMLVGMAVVWQFILDPRVGLLNEFLSWFGIPPSGWLLNSSTALPSIIAFGIWRQTGYMMILFLAGLAAIPRTVYEAGALDGLHGFKRFWHITWPMLAPTTTFAGIIGTIAAVELFDAPKVMTNGGPAGSTTTLAMMIQQEGFFYSSFGTGAVVSLVLFILTLAITAAQWMISRRSPMSGPQ
jgi:multiple sugar transport system permease protein